MIATIAFSVLLAALIIQVIFVIKGESAADPISHYLLLVVSILLFSITVYRSITIKFVAITNTFESLVFFSAVICLILFIYRLRAGKKAIELLIFGTTVIAFILLAVASSPIAPKKVAPPIPALKSYWLVLHVSFSFIGESFFALSFVTAIYYLAAGKKRDTDSQGMLDKLTANFIAIGYPIFTAGALVFGAIWARYAWGSFWSWDPKETWALITWLVYTAYLHARFIGKLRGKFSAVIAIVGFLFTVFTFFGVNFLLSGLHSYG